MFRNQNAREPNASKEAVMLLDGFAGGGVDIARKACVPSSQKLDFGLFSSVE
jgi:hypothetical protein